ncbi:MAG: alkaline phosphatase family protein [Proteobacteria bacterium]|nr:alkaline phosphatase family protein [Pseudomonadota bacterium]
MTESFFSSDERSDRKVLVVGIDGLPQSLITNYIDKGYLPAFKKILGDGHKLCQMDASVPDVSSTSWTSFMTGVNPAAHGIFGFTDLRPNSYDIFFPNAGSITAPPLWDIAGKTGNKPASELSDGFKDKFPEPLRSIVLNIPQTYPASPINGVLTAGFVCPNLQKGTYPAKAYDYLDSIGYMSDVDVFKAVENPKAFFEEVFLSLDKRLKAYEHFMDTEAWDLFIGVITETDRMHHFFFDAALDPNHQHHETFVTFYRRIDEIVGRLYERFMEMTHGKGLFMTMSDHGFTVIDKEVYINAWLRKEGFLKIDTSREYYDQIESGTKAFLMDPARIYLNLEGKYPRGSVTEAESAALVEDLKSRLLAFVDDSGKNVIRKVFTKDELYKGQGMKNAPDIVCLANDGFDLKGKLDKDEIFSKGHFTGMHTSYDAHCIMPQALDTKERLHIEHLAGLMLGALAK